jgi:hypothetical protein
VRRPLLTRALALVLTSASLLSAVACGTAHARNADDARSRKAGPQSAASCVATRGLDASFLQLTRVAALRPRDEWERLFADMAQVGVKQVFVQWTLADGVAFYARDPQQPDDVPILDLLFGIAEQHGMRLWLGLAHDAGWWAGIDRARPAREVEVFLARRRLANLAVARALAPAVANRPSFAGWYVPDEIDDKNWLGEERTTVVADYLTALGRELATLVPGAGIAVSGFAQGWATPGQVVELWSAITAHAPLSLVLLQDGVGAGKLATDDLPAYLPRLRAALDAQGKQLGVVVELFTGQSSADGTSFTAIPAALDRVERQLEVASRNASGPLVGFSMPDYLSPFGGPAADRAYGAYRSFIARCTSGPARGQAETRTR